MSSAICLNLDKSKILSSGDRLMETKKHLVDYKTSGFQFFQLTIIVNHNFVPSEI